MKLPKPRRRSRVGLTESEAYLALYGAHTRSGTVSDCFPSSWFCAYERGLPDVKA